MGAHGLHTSRPRGVGLQACIHARVCIRRQKHAEAVSELTYVCWLYVDTNACASNPGQSVLRFCTHG